MTGRPRNRVHIVDAFLQDGDILAIVPRLITLGGRFHDKISTLEWFAERRLISNSVNHRIRSIKNAQQAIRHSSVIFVAPYWNYRISCLKVQLAPLAQDADSEKWNISLDYVKKRLEP